ncbi:AT-hook motif nuclear-localized protein 17 [Spatholobus suberectus]|nr:AT-hook motif nuclear-localized protein 17 [Spatholobus suberectus]
MTNNSMAISLSHNSPSSDSESGSSSDHRAGSSSQRHRPPPPPPATNQPPEQLPLATPPNKKPRGRPPGSKNKPKPAPLPLAQPADPNVRLVIVDVPPGSDVMESIFDVARRDHVSVTILSATGMIASVTLRNTPHGAPAVTLHGPFTLLSFTGSYIYNNQYTLRAGATPPPPLSFGINLSTSQGQVFGGTIGGRVVAGNDVTLVASTFRFMTVVLRILVEGLDGAGGEN